jgi:hypothetical protein
VFDFNSVIYGIAKHAADAVFAIGVKLEAIRRKLEASIDTGFQSLKKRLGCVTVAFADVPMDDKLAVTRQREEHVLIASLKVAWFRVLLQAIHKGIDLVDLHVCHRDILKPHIFHLRLFTISSPACANPAFQTGLIAVFCLDCLGQISLF